MQQSFDINVLWQEAHKRWLKPSEVLFILQNHERLPITSEPPHQPPSGSLFLFNRRVLRFFRKDGYLWRRKRDGRTVGEAHERLKVGNVDALSCYYAHGEQNPYFQRRSYWMLDPAYEHIVLVHYREVVEGRYTSGTISNYSTESASVCHNQASSSNTVSLASVTVASELNELNDQHQTSCNLISAEEVSSKPGIRNFEIDNSTAVDKSGQPEFNQALKKLAEQLSLDDDDDDDNCLYLEKKQPTFSVTDKDAQVSEYLDNDLRKQLHEELRNIHGLEFRKHVQTEAAGSLSNQTGDDIMKQSQSHGKHQRFEKKVSPSWMDMLELTSNSSAIDASRTPNLLDSHGFSKLSNYRTELGPEKAKPETSLLLFSSERDKISDYPVAKSDILPWPNGQNGSSGHPLDDNDLHLQLSATRRFLLGSDDSIESPSSNSLLREIEDNHASGANIFPDSNWKGSMPLTSENNTYNADFSNRWFDHHQFDTSLGVESNLTLGHKQRFSIREISPEWAFSVEITKVIITGDFLCDPSDTPWAVMFGNIEVPVEIIQEGVLRCWTPRHRIGRVALCITAANRVACSEVRKFEFRGNPSVPSFTNTEQLPNTTKTSEEVLLLAKLVQMLLSQKDTLGPFCKIKRDDPLWQQLMDKLQIGDETTSGALDQIVEVLLKDKLQHWLLSMYQQNHGTECFLSKQEQGIIHFISGLGYEWALSPIFSAGVGINFRDANGWTALHWAAHFGREKMVAALLAAGASANAVTDPTTQDLVGKTAGFIACARGHKGLAGYLSEVALTSHLSSLNMEREISRDSATVQAERTVESTSHGASQSHGDADGESFKDFLAAVRNATQAAARIQATFRAFSFRKRQLKSVPSPDEYGMTSEEIQELSAATKPYNFHHNSHYQKYDKAALSIQKRYRGYKGRKNFLTLRKHVVKIQAHVRGHQVRKEYRDIVWSVSVVEKAVLRWRRKGHGLRGFRAEPDVVHDDEQEDVAKIFRRQKVDAAVDEAVSRVLSMVDSPDARQQYSRMLEYNRAKAELSSSDEATSRHQDDLEIADTVASMY